jgi:hypothetical protein
VGASGVGLSVKKYELSANAALGFDLMFNKYVGMMLDGRIQQGLTNINEDANSDSERVFNRNIQVLAGLSVGF